MHQQIPTETRGQRAAGAWTRWYVLTLLSLIYIFDAVDKSVVGVIAEPLKHEFRLTDRELGALGGLAYAVPFSLSVLPLGWLVDRVNRRNLLSLTVAIWSALTALCAVAPNFATLLIARMGVGAAEGAATPGSISLIADTFPPRRRNTALAVYYAGAGAGQLVTLAAGGLLLIHFRWRALYLVAGAPGLVLAALLFWTTKEPRRGAFEAQSPAATPGAGPSTLAALRAVFAHPRLLSAMLGATIANGVMFSLTIWATSFLVRLHGLSVGHAAVWAGVVLGILQVAGSLIAGPLADRFSRDDPRRLALFPALGTAAGALSGMLAVLAGGLPLALAGLCLTALCAGCFVTTGYGLILRLAAPNARGSTVAAAKLSAALLGNGLTPIFTGAISDYIDRPDAIRYGLLATVVLLFAASGGYALSASLHRSRSTQSTAPLGVPESARPRRKWPAMYR